MAILDTSSMNTYLADTMTNRPAAADLVTGPMNPSSYVDPVLSNISLTQLPNLDPTQALDNLVGDNMPPLPPIPVLNTDVSEFISGLSEGVLDKVGSVFEIIDVSDELSQIMQIVNGLATVVSYVENGIQTLTDGNIPDDIKNQVIAIAAQAIGANGGTASLGLYSQISGIMLPFVSGHTESSLSMALKASKLLGMSDQILSSAGDSLVDSFRDDYDTKMTSLDVEFDALTTGDGLLKTVNAGGGGAGGAGGGGGADAPSVNAEGVLITAANPPNLQIPVPAPEVKFDNVDGSWEFESGDTNEKITAGGQFVSSVEELECEMSVITRDVSEVIVHWSETFTNANLTGSELGQLTGSGTNAYHYIIKRDGSMERGVPLNSNGSASPGHNSYSIQVCLVGGVNVASEDDAINGNLGASSITRTQFNTLHQLFRVFFVQFPGGQALGHGEFATDQLDPGFEVRDYVYNSFNKRSLYSDPVGESEKSPQEIIAGINSEVLLFGEKDTEDSGLKNF